MDNGSISDKTTSYAAAMSDLRSRSGSAEFPFSVMIDENNHVFITLPASIFNQMFKGQAALYDSLTRKTTITNAEKTFTYQKETSTVLKITI